MAGTTTSAPEPQNALHMRQAVRLFNAVAAADTKRHLHFVSRVE
jgi:hypothetical protein